ncbi:hypothetical protein SH661x_003215 [Planctomicrobium sp. SH661]|uniref:hypothetical protein n=1 Tax=Planctomicrobium sp. SH661 TaxID=3448124 RepID=UPI003F5B284A
MTNLNRRNFHQLAAAAFGGLISGSLAGCPGGTPEAGSTKNEPGGSAAHPEAAGESVSLLLQEPHVCRGLNMCKNQGKSKENACAGQGTCASVADHGCAQQNECKGQGGCGANPGENACKGMGGCHIPLMDHAWDSARKNFEAAMKNAGKEVGPAPAKT